MEWVTAAEAAEEFNVSIRQIEERYKPLLPKWAVMEPVKERHYRYDFEVEDVDWATYEVRQTYSTDPMRRQWDVHPDTGRRWDAEMDEGHCFKVYEETGYDYGLEPISRTMRVVRERLYLWEALRAVRIEMMSTRKAPEMKRGAGGRFVGKAA